MISPTNINDDTASIKSDSPHNSALTVPTDLFASVRRSKQTGIKSYFYTDNQNNEATVASFMMKTTFMKQNKKKSMISGKYVPVLMGQGQHAQVVTGYNPNSTIVKKLFTSTYGDPFNTFRIRALINLHTNTKFRGLGLARVVCLPFLISGKENFIFMKKLSGASLEQLSYDDQHISVTKYEVMSLLDAINKLADDEDIRIVHTDIHAGNIVKTDDGTLVLIDFDECISILNKRVPKMVVNPDYIENPSPDDYLNGYCDDIPYAIPAELTTDEEAFYQTQGSYDYLKNQSIIRFKNLFIYGDNLLFNDEKFLQTDNSDNTIDFQVKIRVPHSDDSSEEY